MTRKHSLLSVREAERRLAETMNEIDGLQATEDYELDLQFFGKLVHLMQRYGFSPDQVAEILLTREMSMLDRSSADSGREDLTCLRTLVGLAPSSNAKAVLVEASPAAGDGSAQR